MRTSASVDVTADAELHDTHSEQRDDSAQQPRPQRARRMQTRRGQQPLEIPEENPENELIPWVNYMKRITHEADDLLSASRITSWIIAKHHEDRWTKLVFNWNPATSTKQKGCRKQGRPAKRWEVRLQHLLTTRQNQQRQQRPHERHDLAYHSGTQLEKGCFGKRIHTTAGSNNQHDPRPLPTRLRQPNQQHTSKQRIRPTPTTKTKTTPKTTTIRCSSSLNELTVEPPQNQSNYSRPKSSNQDFSRHIHPE